MGASSLALLAAGVLTGISATSAGATTTFSHVTGFPVECSTAPTATPSAACGGVSGTDTTTIPLTTGATNDLVVLFIEIHSLTTSVTSVVSPNITWSSNPATTEEAFGNLHLEEWYGVTTSASTATTTVTFSSTVTRTNTRVEMVADSFHASTGSGAWRPIAAGHVTAAASGTTVRTPLLKSGVGGGVYAGYLWFGSSYKAPSTPTPGFSYFPTAAFNLEVSDAALLPSTTYWAVATQSTSNSEYTSLAGIFAVTATPALHPTVTGIQPSSGPVAGGTSVTISGTNFQPRDTVKFGTKPGAVTSTPSSTRITVTAPAGTGTVDVTVTDAGGGGSSPVGPADQFTYQPLPVVTSVSPNRGRLRGGNLVTISGTNILTTDTAFFGTHGSSMKTNTTPGEVVVYAPPGASGTVPVTLRGRANGTGVPNLPVDKYTYVATVPTVTGVSPTSGPAAGGSLVTITGTNFQGQVVGAGPTTTTNEQVLFGTVAATTVSVTYGSKVAGVGTTFTRLTAKAPSGSTTVNVTVVTPMTGRSSSAVSNPFTYIPAPPPAPTVTGVRPTTGLSTGGTVVTVTGTHFATGDTVDFNSTPGTGVHVTSGGTSLRVTTPPGSVGTVDVTVTGPGGTSATSSADQFTYQAPAPTTGGTKGGTSGGTKGGTSGGTSGGSTPSTPPVTKGSGSAGYDLVASDGGIFAFTAPFHGSMGGKPLNQPVVGMAEDAQTGGYWEVAQDGGIFAFDAPFHGSMGGKPLNQPIVGMAYDPLTGGYYEVASDGGIFAFDAPFHGSMGGKPLNQPIVGMAFDPATGGYWEVARDGGIFAFDAPFHGSMGGKPLNQPIEAMTFDAQTGGYYEVASDGGLFAFGAPFAGSMGGMPLNQPIVAMAADPHGGYWEFARDGGVFAFGGAPSPGSVPGMGIHVTDVVGAGAVG